MTFPNTYEDRRRAEAYATLEFPGTYHLAFRDLPALISEHVRGHTALDFGCGAGRSTRFLAGLGFETVGVDVSAAMVELARAADPAGEYLLVGDGDYAAVGPRRFDLVLSTFAFDNIAGAEHRAGILRALAGLLSEEGRMVLVGCRPEVYVHEWASFTTAEFPENRHARSGGQVRLVMTDVDDRRPVVDIVWFHDDWLTLFDAAGLELVATHTPVGRDDEPFPWVSETSVAPWFIYVLRRAA